MIKAKQLKNGMRFHLVPFKGTEAMTVLVLTDVGSRHENPAVFGGSHVIEHMMFKGTKRRPTTLDISKELDRYGAEFNAYTGKDLTGYYVKITKDKAATAIDLLHDMLFHSKFDPKELKREKKVIVEEIKMYEENPIMHIGDLIEQVMFDGAPLGREIAGTPESVVHMKRADLLKYQQTHYTPEKMVVVLAGAVPKDAESLLEKSFGRVKTPDLPLDAYEVTVLDQQTKARLAVQYKPLKQIQLAFGFPTVGREHKDVPSLKILANLLGGSMSSRLFIEVRERKGLCYSIRARAGFYEDVGKFIIKAGLDADRLDDAVKTIFKELEKIKKHGVTQKELRYTKDHMKGSSLLSLEDSSTCAEFHGRQELQVGAVKSVEERLAEIEKVKRADVKRVANEVFELSRLSVAAIGPYKTSKDLQKHFKGII